MAPTTRHRSEGGPTVPSSRDASHATISDEEHTEPPAASTRQVRYSPHDRESSETTQSSGTPELAQDLSATRLAQRHAELKRRVLEKRRLEEIENMERELAGETPSNPVQIEDTTPPSRKRNADDPPERAAKYLKPNPPKEFKGQSFGELRAYLDAWQLRFGIYPSLSDKERIAQAATSLGDIAASRWLREPESLRPTTWIGFSEFLRDIVQDSANRMASALRKLWRYYQSDNQSAREVLKALARLREDVATLKEEERHAWEFLLALRPETQLAVLRELPKITSQELVLRSAQRHEELARTYEGQRGGRRSQANRKRTDTPTDTPVVTSQQQADTETKKDRRQRTPYRKERRLVGPDCHPGSPADNTPWGQRPQVPKRPPRGTHRRR
ncbi:hypothetical protein AYL99_09814 [Fonsecaea erecta]|uniref:Uncharacterized protein n=1 Tax=Fonsecaea erecta TaxID=1367422 RepID=A0A178Z7I2_9EURO|nr:hypothetical protein AYL99_09814 [Fonsecaea erecta]OAP55662.1 hypothetical protein AYL99_09814 [Fonsecaea erecta]